VWRRNIIAARLELRAKRAIGAGDLVLAAGYAPMHRQPQCEPLELGASKLRTMLADGTSWQLRRKPRNVLPVSMVGG